jgi:hypothetical protein|nr:MAG TPA: Exonuclease [Bacteriophage sp.]
MIEQGSSEWLKQRLGKITGSRIGDLMTSGKKGEMFGKTALSYIYEVCAERDLLQKYMDDDYLFEIYQRQVSINNKFIEFGHDNEDFAAERYQLVTECKLEECESIQHPTISHFSASPDRIAIKDGLRKVVEIKVPLPKTFMEYMAEVKDNETLKSVNPKYYYQTMAEMACTGLDKADFVVFCPFLKHNIHIVEITRDEAVIAEFEKRIMAANEIINQILNKK